MPVPLKIIQKLIYCLLFFILILQFYTISLYWDDNDNSRNKFYKKNKFYYNIQKRNVDDNIFHQLDTLIDDDNNDDDDDDDNNNNNNNNSSCRRAKW